MAYVFNQKEAATFKANILGAPDYPKTMTLPGITSTKTNANEVRDHLNLLARIVDWQVKDGTRNITQELVEE